jgi:hypothetical protein
MFTICRMIKGFYTTVAVVHDTELGRVLAQTVADFHDERTYLLQGTVIIGYFDCAQEEV